MVSCCAGLHKVRFPCGKDLLQAITDGGEAAYAIGVRALRITATSVDRYRRCCETTLRLVAQALRPPLKLRSCACEPTCGAAIEWPGAHHVDTTGSRGLFLTPCGGARLTVQTVVFPFFFVFCKLFSTLLLRQLTIRLQTYCCCPNPNPCAKISLQPVCVIVRQYEES
jgi:hypothetical protein